jgi:uncharacterized protein YuzE
MRTTYDSEHDILYIDIAEDRKVHDTQPLNDDIFVDFDEERNIVGIEIWQATRNIVEPVAQRLIEKVRAALEVAAK